MFLLCEILILICADPFKFTVTKNNTNTRAQRIDSSSKWMANKELEMINSNIAMETHLDKKSRSEEFDQEKEL
jgi:hypothetical protein